MRCRIHQPLNILQKTQFTLRDDVIKMLTQKVKVPEINDTGISLLGINLK